MRLELVECTPEHWEFVRLLRTDPRTSPGFFRQEPITPEQQQDYMALHWHQHLICLLDDQPVGYVGVIEDDLRVCVHPDHQRQGLGRFMIYELIAHHPRAVAKVKADNTASRKLFEACGFHPAYVVYTR